MPKRPTPGTPSFRPGAPPKGDPLALLAQARAHHAQGRPREAEAAYRAVLAARPDLVEALVGLSDLATRAGRPDAARDLLIRATALAPKDAQAHMMLGNALLALGDPTGAARVLDHALALKPRSADAALLRGMADQRRGNIPGAAEWFRKAIKARKDHPDAHQNLGSCLLMLGDVEGARAALTRAAALAPKSPVAHCSLAQALFDGGLMDRARTSVERALALDAAFWPARPLRARILEAQEDYPAARAAWEDCVARAPNDPATLPATLNDAAAFMMHDNRFDRAEALARRAATLRPDDLEIRKNLVRVLMVASRNDAAEAECAAWVSAHGVTPGLSRLFGDVLVRAGRFDEARDQYLIAWEAEPDNGVLAYSLSTTGKFKAGDALGDRILAAHAEARARGRVDADLAYAAGKVLDDRKDWDGAFSAYAEANAEQAARLPFDIDAHDAHVAALKAVFTPALFDRLSTLGDPSERPVFVVGLPRSGTTLVERVIAAHAEAAGAGELTHVPRLEHALPWILSPEPGARLAYPSCVERLTAPVLREFTEAYLAELTRLGGGAARVVDKLPNNFLRLGLIHLAFPRARIVHCRRNLVDTCLSIHFQNFLGDHAYRFDLGILGRYARAYVEIMDHWRAVLPEPPIEVVYDDLVHDQEGESRRLLAALGLSWDADVLTFHEKAGVVATASRWQARQPVHAGSVARWKAYEAHLAPLLAALPQDESAI
jgi:tetratricopeptide (TPR) repeat protein